MSKNTNKKNIKKCSEGLDLRIRFVLDLVISGFIKVFMQFHSKNYCITLDKSHKSNTLISPALPQQILLSWLHVREDEQRIICIMLNRFVPTRPAPEDFLQSRGDLC